MVHRPMKIISGGQTGVDRAALDYAIESSIEHGGWCPRGRVAEDGPIGSQYQLSETRTHSYPARTKMNVRDSDATLIFYRRPMSGGTALTMRTAQSLGKPLFVARLDDPELLASLKRWLDETKPQTLNIAGPRESNSPGIQEQVMDLLRRLFSETALFDLESEDA